MGLWQQRFEPVACKPLNLITSRLLVVVNCPNQLLQTRPLIWNKLIILLKFLKSLYKSIGSRIWYHHGNGYSYWYVRIWVNDLGHGSYYDWCIGCAMTPVKWMVKFWVEVQKAKTNSYSATVHVIIVNY